MGRGTGTGQASNEGNKSFIICPTCKGRRWDIKPHDGERRTCPKCGGKGSIPKRKLPKSKFYIETPSGPVGASNWPLD